MTVTVGVITFPGSCDDLDAVSAVERVAGAQARPVWHTETTLESFDAVVIPGGFSYGDYLRAGAIARFAPVMDAVADFASSGAPVLGICNGFQVLCEAGLLPGALLVNGSLKFVCRQVELEVVRTRTPFTHGFAIGDTASIPVKNRSGRYFASPDMVAELRRDDRIVFRYAPGTNPSDSVDDIAGVCNERGNVVGLMPHPEHAVDPVLGSTDGARMFESLVAHAGSRA